MGDFSPAEHTRYRLAARAVTGIGILLLVIGGVLAYPYIHSRLAALPRAPRLTPSAPYPTALPSSPTAANVILTSTPAPSATSRPPATTSSPVPTPTAALPTRVVIPGIGVDAPVVPVSLHTLEAGDQRQSAWKVPATYAAGWHEASAPLGLPGNTVLNGHNTTNGEIFRDLYTLQFGDAIIAYSGNTPYTYTVSDTLILPEAGLPLETRIENARFILPTDDERLTLVTCHPYGSLRHRLIVIARPKG